MAKGLKLNITNFFWLIPTFVEVTGEKLVRGGGGAFCPSLSPSGIGLILALHRNWKFRTRSKDILTSSLDSHIQFSISKPKRFLGNGRLPFLFRCNFFTP